MTVPEASRTSCVMAIALVVLLGNLLVGCTNTRGPELVVNSHLEYNRAVSQVLKEELLLNVVRRRYMEAPQFLNISSINSNFSTTSTVGAGASVVDVGAANIWDNNIDGSVSFSDSPTITITPRQGEDMANQLHKSLSVSTIADLVAAGYPVERVLTLLVEGVNNLRGPTLAFDHFQSGSLDWIEAITLVREFSDSGTLIVDRFRWNDPYNTYPYPADSITPEMWITTLSTGARRWKSYDGGKTFYFTTHEMAPAMWLDMETRRTPEGQRLMSLLNLQPDVEKNIWTLEPARVAAGADLAGRTDSPRSSLKLRMRSLYNVLNFYAYGVHVPPQHEEEGRATDLSSFRQAVERGEILDLTEFIAIKYSESVPDSAFQAVKYRGLWFYIDDRHMRSKAAFNALYDLWQLSIKAPAAQSPPINTIQLN